jgi:hypothetical protein
MAVRAALPRRYRGYFGMYCVQEYADQHIPIRRAPSTFQEVYIRPVKQPDHVSSAYHDHNHNHILHLILLLATRAYFNASDQPPPPINLSVDN